MKTRLRLLYFSILVCCIFGFSNKTYAQINYSQDFEIDEGGWSDDDFFAFYFFPCTGENALTGEIYSDPDFGDYTAPVTISPSLGNSNGLQATLTYSYSLIDWNTFEGVTNTPDWGEFSIEYASSPSGPWTNLQTIDPSNHVESDDCAVKTVTFTPPVGPVYLRISGTPNDYIDVLINIDNISVVQVQEACTGTPAASAAVADQPALCNGGTVNLSLAPAYAASGLIYQWQSSADGVSYSNVPTGGTSAAYATTQAASMWYRATITCSGGGSPVTSTPVHVINSGMPCLCDVAFTDDIEPITHVVFAGIDNTTSAAINGTPGVEDFTSLALAEVTPGETYQITLEGNTNDPDGDAGYETYITAFFDWNQDGDFEDDSERYDIDYLIFSDGEDGVQITGDIAVPAGALPGNTYMRVFKLYNHFPDTACGVDGEFGYGQVEDYLVHVAAPSTETLDYVNLQWPATMTFAAGGSDTAYAQAWEGGVTEAPGAGAGITAWIGISPVGSNTNPNTWTTWVPATFNTQAGNNDEYMATIGTGLAPGTYYYASRFQLNGGPYTYGGYTPTGGGYWDGTTNISGILTVTCATPAPTAAAAQTLCQGSTIADIDVTGTSITWYGAATGGTALPATTMIADGTTYYASATAGGCESVARTPVTVDITVTPAPTADETMQTFCNAAGLDDLEIDGDGEIMWYGTQTGGSMLADDTALADNTTYYAAQVIDGCESMARTGIMVHITVSEAPSGEAEQEIEVASADDATIEDIEITATGSVNWYDNEEDAEAGEDAIAPETVIVSGTYYATQTIDGCESAPFAVTVDITLGNDEFNTSAFRYHPNPVKDVLAISYAKNISAIEVYNIVGQKVIVKSVNQNEAQLDMSQLAAGTYMVKVMGDTAYKTIKVVKQ
ncbi:hypothetical protein HYN59_09135 [Flavobacterium album]|uniref:Secretion system C-terminal sorting domain-containing protein n=1 Tax=Flavobacterium album TaxID=2175091 RepID=A0A2S1QYE5_9FLAO|nr:GEVED domain-containing protein [Flavobacterium album]AWH85271.1 hypothetical protein HYN59_09135 [Flavobacterium album]